MNDIYKEIQALNQSKLPPRAKALYLAFMELANDESKCKAILDSLVYRSGTSESTVIRATKELEAAGFISVRRFAKSGPSTPPNIYTLLHRTVKSRQIDSTSAVKLTSKTNIKIEGSNTNTACHHDTRGKAPSVMDDRLKDSNKNILSVLEEHQPFFNEEEVMPIAREIVSQIAISALESKLQGIVDHYESLETFKPPIQDSLKDILEEIYNPSDTSVPKN